MIAIIVTRQNTNGTYDNVGMGNRAMFNHYKTVRGAIKYGAKAFANGKPFRVEVYPSGNVYAPCNWVLHFDSNGSRI